MLQDEARERKKQLKRELQEKNRAELAKVVGLVVGLSLVDCIMVHTYVGYMSNICISLSTKQQMLSGLKRLFTLNEFMSIGRK